MDWSDAKNQTKSKKHKKKPTKKTLTNLWQLIGRDVGCKTVEIFFHLCYLFLINLLFKSMGAFMGANILYSYVSS